MKNQRLQHVIHMELLQNLKIHLILGSHMMMEIIQSMIKLHYGKKKAGCGPTLVGRLNGHNVSKEALKNLV